MSQFFTTENLRAFLDKNPDSMAFAHLGARLIDEGEYQGAIEVCQKGLDKHPEYSFGHFIMGTAHYHVKNYTDAKKELEKALAYDPNNPRAWEILSAINEILNLSDDSKESNLQSYLIDFLNKDASSQYIFEIDASTAETAQAAPAEPPKETISPEETPTDMAPQEKDVGEMLDDVLAGGEEEYDFDKTLDDVFKDKEEEATVNEKQTEQELPQVQEDATSEIVPSDKEGLVSADEFTTAIESFFSDYEKEEETSVSTPAETEAQQEEIKRDDTPPESITPEMPSDELEELTETDVSSEQIPEFDPTTLHETSDESPIDDTAQPSPEEPREAAKTDDELLDFQTFVSDVIKDTDEEAQAGVIQEVPDLPEVTEEEILPQEVGPPTDSEPLLDGEDSSTLKEMVTPEVTESALPEEELEIPKEEDFISPFPPIQDIPDSGAEPPIVPDETPGELAGEDVTPKFSKPPILSPTLGEIYIAQGRFEEAINVFKQLMEKDPENSRFKRKISDLQNIITKKKLSS
jgi:tetratricopeptide (TPR) repeat protein